MSKISQGNLLHPGIPGTISVMSRENTVHNPSLVQDIWEFDHDPDDQFIKKIIRDKQARLRKQHSHQQLQKHIPLYPNDSSNVNPQKYRYHSQVTMQIEKNQYGLAGNNQNNLYGLNKHYYDRQSISRSKSGGSHNQTGRQKQRKSKSNQSKDSLQHIRNIENIARSLPGFEGSIIPHQADFYGQQNQSSKDNNLKPHQLHYSPTRNLDIYSHKYISNLTYLLTQLKELLIWNKMHRYQSQIQQNRKNIMKLQIECRKLKIGLRNSVSMGGMFKLRRKQYIGGIGENQDGKNVKSNSKDNNQGKNQILREYHHGNRDKKKSLMKSTWGNRPSKTSRHSRTSKIQSQRQKTLQDLLNSQKKKYQQLGTRQSLVTNYYNVLKNKLYSELATDNTLNDDPITKPLSKHEIPTTQTLPYSHPKKEELIILQKRKNILEDSIKQSKQHYQIKIKQLSEEIVIMKKQFQIIQSKLYGIKVSKQQNQSFNHKNYYQSKPQQLYYNNNLPSNSNKKTQLRRNPKNSSSSQKKLLFKLPSSPNRQQLTKIPHHKFPQTKNTNWKLHKIKSSRDFYPIQSEEKGHNSHKKISKDYHINQHNQYFVNKKNIQSGGHNVLK